MIPELTSRFAAPGATDSALDVALSHINRHRAIIENVDSLPASWGFAAWNLVDIFDVACPHFPETVHKFFHDQASERARAYTEPLPEGY
jgi:hypothetical protein